MLDSPERYAGGDDGIIGPGILELFDVYLDFGHGKIYLDPR